MSISLYQATVGSFLQTLGGLSTVLERGFAHCAANVTDPGELMDARLTPDMWPLQFQAQAVVHHSVAAIEGARNGLFAPPPKALLADYAAMQQMVKDAQDSLQRLAPADVEGLVGKPVVFRAGEREVPFTADAFLLSLSLPNVFFHATTAYDILRSRGVGLIKRDYMGQLRSSL